MITGSVIVARILYNDKDEEFEDEETETLRCDCCEPPVTKYRYIGTGSNLVSPTYINTDDYDTAEEEDKALEEAHTKDMAKVYDATVAYREKLLRELAEVDAYLKENQDGNN